MKKFAIGCFGVVVLLAVGGVGVVWFKFGDEITTGINTVSGWAQLAPKIEELNESIENRSGFSPPADGELTEQMLGRFLAAQRSMRNQLESRLEELQQKYEAMEQEIDERGGQASISEMLSAYGDLTELLVDAKRAQVEALNSQGFSLQEYNWVRGQVYRALGESVAVAAIAESGTATTYETTVSEETRELVEPHREELMESYVLAWWGL